MLLTIALLACNGSTPPPPAEPPPPPPPTHRETTALWRDLIQESWRAELDVSGLLIDMGAPDQHKYTRGGWDNGWGELGSEGPLSYANAPAKRQWVDVWVQESQVPTEIVVQLRSPVADQVLTVRANGKSLGDVPVPEGWGSVRLPVQDLSAGRHRLQLDFKRSNPKGPRAQVDWIWLASGALPLEGVNADPVPVARKELAKVLPAPTPRSWDFYLEVPEGSTLVFDGSGSGTAVISAQVDGQASQELARHTAPAGEVVVDLSPVSGKMVKLSLTSQDGPVDWGKPQLRVDTVKPFAQVIDESAPTKVLVILIDTVRADVFAAWDPDNGVNTPVVDKLAAEGVVFLNAYDNENWTKPSVATNLSGLRPVTHQAKKESSKLKKEVELLPEILQDDGFQTAAFIANGFVSKSFGFNQGWDHFTNFIRESRNTGAENVFTVAGNYIEKNPSEKSFIYIQTIDPHVPYIVPRKFIDPYFPEPYRGSLGQILDGYAQADISKGKKKITETDHQWIEALYHAEISYHDEQLGLFLERLSTSGWLDDAVVIITNDHGEEVGEHGRYGHGHSLYEELIRAPLIIRDPKRLQAGVVTDVVEQVDLSPTILDLLNIEHTGMDGRTLMPTVANQPTQRPGYAVSDFLSGKRAVRVGDWKMMVSTGDWVELYNLASDPGETEDLDETAWIARRACEVYMGESLASPDKGGVGFGQATEKDLGSEDIAIDGELAEQLEALGYFEH